MKDYCYRKIKKKFKVFPSRYAGFALARCRRKLGKNPGKKIIAYHVTSENFDVFRTPAEFTDKAGAERLLADFPGEKVIKVILRLGRAESLDMKKVDPDDKAKLKTYMAQNRLDSVFVPSNWGDRDDIIVFSPGQIKILGKGGRELLNNPRPPKAVARVACRGLAKRRKYKRGGTMVGVARARDLCNRRRVTMATVKRMSSYFARHRASRAENRRRIADPVSPARIADELWGGTPGWRWAKKVLG